MWAWPRGQPLYHRKGVEMIACALIALAIGAIHAFCDALAGQGLRGLNCVKRNLRSSRAFPFPTWIIQHIFLVTTPDQRYHGFAECPGQRHPPHDPRPGDDGYRSLSWRSFESSLAIVFLVALPPWGSACSSSCAGCAPLMAKCSGRWITSILSCRKT